MDIATFDDPPDGAPTGPTAPPEALFTSPMPAIALDKGDGRAMGTSAGDDRATA